MACINSEEQNGTHLFMYLSRKIGIRLDYPNNKVVDSFLKSCNVKVSPSDISHKQTTLSSHLK